MHSAKTIRTDKYKAKLFFTGQFRGRFDPENKAQGFEAVIQKHNWTKLSGLENRKSKIINRKSTWPIVCCK